MTEDAEAAYKKLDKSEELEGINDSLDKIIRDVDKCMTKEDARKIWNYMQRFPHYDDLKDLNNKFLPELAKLELQIFKF